MAFALNRYQMESFLRRFAKTILITDHHDWSAEAIYQAYMDRHLLEDQFRRAKNPFHVALMPQYHWTDSKIRIHVFVCVAALTYLTLLQLRLAQAGLDLSIRQTMEELRALRTAIYWLADERKPRRMLKKPTDQQIAILEALGYHVKDGWVPQK
jgi:transposase